MTWPTSSVCITMAVNVTQIRDTKWLTLEVCREFQRGTCSRPDSECKFAHPAKSCQVENGRVIACFDSLKVSMTNECEVHSSLSCYFWLGPAVLTSFGFQRFLVQQDFCWSCSREGPRKMCVCVLNKDRAVITLTPKHTLKISSAGTQLYCRALAELPM